MSYLSRDAWRELSLAWGLMSVPSGRAAGTTIFYPGGEVVLGVAGSAYGPFYFDPADYKASKVRVVARIVTNAVAPGITFTYKLCPVTSWGGASGVRASVASIGAAVATVDIATPAASSQVRAVSAEAAAPAAGWYALAAVLSGTNATNSVSEHSARLQVR